MGRAQIFSLDLTIAVGLFIFILVTSYWFELSILSRIDSSMLLQRLTSTAYIVSNALVLTSGSSGIVSSPNVVSSDLADSFFSSNYTLAKEDLGINYPLEFHISLLDGRKQPLMELGPLLSNSTNSVVLDRIVVYNDSVSLLRIEVWHE